MSMFRWEHVSRPMPGTPAEHVSADFETSPKEESLREDADAQPSLLKQNILHLLSP